MENDKTLLRIKTLTELHGAPGFEEEVRDYMKKEMTPFVDEVITTHMGSIFGVKKSKKQNAKRVMVAAHMDEIGFMITNITQNGMLQFTNLGGVSNDIWQGQRLQVKNRKGEKIVGVVSNIPQLSEHRYSAKAWDNRYGCVLAIEILELLKDVELDVDLYVGANVQEEVGLRGAKASTELIQPDIAFVVDCSPANDIKGKQQLSGQLGEGTLIRIKDGTMILSPRFRDYLLELVDTFDIRSQYYISPGGTDGGEIHKANKGVPTAVIGVCARYIHSTDAVFDIRDYYAARELLKQAVSHLTNENILTLQFQSEEK